MRGLAQIVACDSHPLIVPRVREYLAHEFKVDEAGVHEMGPALAPGGAERARRASLDREGNRHVTARATQITIADICLASQAAGANFFKVDLAPYPTVARIAATCMKNDAFARAHPLKQPGAPAAA